MLVLFTDFGVGGPYVGQMHGVLRRAAPDVPIVDLCHDLPPFDPQGAAYLLAAWAPPLGRQAVFVAVVDPGVGGARAPVIVRAGEQWFVGPANGLFDIVGRRARELQCWEVTWRPKTLSASFHGRDLFAPIGARLATGWHPGDQPADAHPLDGAGDDAGDGAGISQPDWPDDLPAVVYIDRYGNATTGLRADRLRDGTRLLAGGHSLEAARTFSDRAHGTAFWYANAAGLAEIAVVNGNAAEHLGLNPGDPVEILA
ncbi:MAG: SAM-dependent chlorinase/fluorinase [Alphaproteobacteria bacterium]|nr:SAM-dependent chlorinase/fluorinase [Alphaproteobacteria bacterium]